MVVLGGIELAIIAPTVAPWVLTGTFGLIQLGSMIVEGVKATAEMVGATVEMLKEEVPDISKEEAEELWPDMKEYWAEWSEERIQNMLDEHKYSRMNGAQKTLYDLRYLFADSSRPIRRRLRVPESKISFPPPPKDSGWEEEELEEEEETRRQKKEDGLYVSAASPLPSILGEIPI
uniref:Uncharacterized protein n=1 Tax=Chromera velia CCMP2878 TaxID=1169474 RepID=A0A0G4GDZ8_9ALVE|eukprot:Cvel_4562.t1-p1 / transcript=Cvel_4562.t1 / gene=Cvel_4562 / organism=Chromera_velia_CCMP2878 / gene_product=hypothetical protein / transcript_product=hypothetical protein / location=Cvel_scaffold200:50210-51155(-) / protein_length=175 / sequence_SO=supercontig / SO=protein_coding / is_pseudo=false